MKLSKIVLSTAVAAVSVLTLNAGAPPTVMFMPDKTWCNANNYVERSERNGKTRITEKYDEAFLNSDLKNVVVQLNGLMKDNGLPVKDYGATSEIDDEEEMEEEAYNDDTQSGGTMDMTNYEALMNKLRPDIIIKIGWDVNKVGFNYTMSYRLEAIDSYSGKSIAQVTAETPTMKTTVPVAAALKNAATEHMGAFIGRLQEHFDDLQTNGREITVACRIGNNGSGINFNSEYDGKELSTIISDWMNDNTVNHVYSTRNSSRNRISFEQVRIPFKDSAGRVMQAKEFVDQLKRYLRSNYNLKSENTTKGLGAGRLYDICE
ncbi:MAG: hypothetical protein J6B36_05865 [Muribaculaceae bacterium]|mgnify:FL=1|jgi:hypothetical protein|nr:hypothetical protein [Muribaculaceae bacterium]CCX48445.1 putative uncharacterized protein [Bacteroides sp. CAG:927]